MTYKQLNDSYTERTMIWHLGVDAGFFTEFRSMCNAMLYCLENKIRFKLYSADANFSGVTGAGWTEYFATFCDTVNETFNSKYNRHKLPSFAHILNSALKERRPSLIAWKMKSIVNECIGRIAARRAYGRGTLLNVDIKKQSNRQHRVAELGIEGNDVQSYKAMAEIAWHLNEHTKKRTEKLIGDLHLPPKYVSCQLRGGDKIIETATLSERVYMDEIARCTHLRDIFVLTDDYAIFNRLQNGYPEYHFYTLCSASEHGYVNKEYIHSEAAAKHERTLRFLASIEAILQSSFFVGTMTTGPSLFAHAMLHPRCSVVDYPTERLNDVYTMTMEERVAASKKYLNGEMP